MNPTLESPRAFGRRARLVFAMFLVSGFAGLIYESVWSHYVQLFLGHASYAQTLVLVVFIGGLALGSWVCARHAERVRNPLRAYAAVEAAIGVLALLFHHVFVLVTEWGYATLLPATCEPGTTVCLSQWLLSAALLAPQSILLGATFPLVSSAVVRMLPERAGHDIASLYFLNSLGAVAGVLGSAFVLIPQVGLPGALLTAGIANLGIATAAYFLSKDVPSALDHSATAPPPGALGTSGAQLRRVLLTIALLTGLSSFIYEIAWIRMLTLVLGASTYSFELMLASFILGIAMGGWWIRSRLDGFADPVKVLAYVQVAMGLAAVATIGVYNGTYDVMAWLLRVVSRDADGFAVFNAVSAAICLAVMLPATFCAGMTLPLLTYRLLRSEAGERSLGLVYAANTVGSIAGVMIAVHLLMTHVGVGGTLVAGAAIDVLLGAYLFARSRQPSTVRAIPAPAVALMIAFLALAMASGIDPRRKTSGVFRSGNARLPPGPAVIYERDGKTATVDVIGTEVTRAIFTNGKSDAALTLGYSAPPRPDEFTMTLIALLPLGHHPEARTAAVIGFGSGLTTAILLGSERLQRVDTIEIEPSMVEGAHAFLPNVQAAYADPRSHIVIDDAKSYFARGSLRYDMIVSEPSNPWVSGVSSLFTDEFYRRLSVYLADGGVLAQWVQTYEMDSATLASIVMALRRTFPDFLIYAPDDRDMLIVARKGGPPGTFDASVLRLPRIQAQLRKLKITSVEGVTGKALVSSVTASPYFASFGMPANSDYFPVVDHRASMTRFTQAQVNDFRDLAESGVPLLEMFDGALGPATRPGDIYPVVPAEERALSAWAARDAALGLPVPDSRVSADAQLGRTVRAWSRDCTGWSFEEMLPTLANFADRVNGRLDGKLAGEIWASLSGGACAPHLDANARGWLQLFSASGARDARGMVEHGRAVLAKSGEPGAATEYALIATTAGLTCLGHGREALAWIEQGAPRWVRPGKHEAELRYLRSIAAGGAPKAGTCHPQP